MRKIKKLYGRTWRLDREQAENIKRFLIETGGKEEKTTNPYEIWRIKLQGSTFVFYSSGKMYSTSSEEVENIWDKIDTFIYGDNREERRVMIGFDETGKGELFGPLITCGVFMDKDVLSEISKELKTPDTKKTHSYNYWNNVFSLINRYISNKFIYFLDLIEPREIDRFNINLLMDLSYKKLIRQIFENLYIKDARVVIDNYGLGDGFKRFLEFLRKEKDIEIVVVSNSEEKFFEVKLASLIAKSYREKVLLNISEYYGIPHDIVRGNLSDKKLLTFLENYKYQDHWFIRKSFGFKKNKEKPSFINLVSEEGKIRCFYCSRELEFVFLKDFKFICPNCGKEIKDLDLAFKYFSGIIKVDLENYKVILEILEKTQLLDGYKLIMISQIENLFSIYERLGRIVLLSQNSPFKSYLRLNLDRERIVFSFFRNI